MKFIADLHLHSKYSRAVSQDMNIPTLFQWGKIKGIDLLGTADFTHPFWFHDLTENLEENDKGVLTVKGHEEGPYFVFTTEISSIYTQGGKVRKIHNVVIAPSFAVVEKINQKLGSLGNLISDGRPILGISAKDLVEIVMEISEECLVIPAHIWTPWFSLYGSNSGFDSLAECFGGASAFISAVETGLSSDPAMNWRIQDLTDKQIVSFSDAHSPAKLGREATVFEGELSYKGLLAALKGEKEPTKIIYTIEFFPEEGKYHFTGHRDCGVSYSPEDTKKLGTICPVCGRKLTVGVMHRVEALACRSSIDLGVKSGLGNLQSFISQKSREPEKGAEVSIVQCEKATRPPYVMLVPLMEIIAEARGVGVASQAVSETYRQIVERAGSEFAALLDMPDTELNTITSEKIVEGIVKVRKGEIVIAPGFDGVFGKVSIWGKEKPQEESQQMSLF